MIRITLICPEPLLAEGRALLLALGTGPQDADALHLSDWRNGATGAAVAVASSEMPEDWLLQLSAPLQRPDWDGAAQIDMQAAARAQAALHLWDETGHPSPTDPQAIILAKGLEPRRVLELAHLSQNTLEG
jgi:hypothetical protein